MIVIVQCASRKRADAGHLWDDDGNPVTFVANPALAPTDQNTYARPDDLISDTNATFRDLLSAYNLAPHDNPWNLLPAGNFYDVPVYAELSQKVEPSKLFILSAGWGLIRADFLIPTYDITFSNQAEVWKRRSKSNQYLDYSQIDEGSREEIVAFCTPAYHELLSQLTYAHPGPKVIYRRVGNDSLLPGWQYRDYSTSTRTNWHYECIKNFLK